jgi:hypothetical protein
MLTCCNGILAELATYRHSRKAQIATPPFHEPMGGGRQLKPPFGAKQHFGLRADLERRGFLNGKSRNAKRQVVG